MTRHRILVLSAMALGAILWTNACDGGTEPPPPDPPRPTTVTVTPSAAELAALEATVQLTAEVRDQYGNMMAGASVSWSSSDGSVAAVDGSGLVTAAGNGAVTITATAGQASGTAAVTVAQMVAAVMVTPEAHTLVAIGDTVHLVAEGRDANGHAVAGAEFEWSSDGESVATVDGSGLVTAAGNGAATITATSGQASGTAAVTVAQVVAAVAVTPEAHTLVAFGDAVRLVAEARDANGHVVAGAEFEWSSDGESVATVDAGGLVTAAGNGAATITATSGQASGTAAVTVAQVVAAVTVAPGVDTLAAFGDTVRLAAEGHDVNGHVVTEAEFEWASDGESVASVDAEGLVTAAGNGAAIITATSGQASATATVTVAQVVAAVAVAPEAHTLVAFGDTVRLAAEGRDANGHVVTEAEFEWSSDGESVATVDAAGLVTAAGNGAATLTATSGQASGTAAVTVAQVVAAVTVKPEAHTLVAIGDTVRLAAEGHDVNGHVVAGAEFEWSSDGESVASVDAEGLVTAAGNGATTLTATSGQASGTAAVTVAQVVATVAVTPEAHTLVALGDTVRLAAEARDANSYTVAGAEFEWSSDGESVATVDGSGLVTAAGTGTATISATSGQASGAATVSVGQVAATVTVTPEAHTLVAIADTVRLFAKARDANGHVVVGAEFAWATDGESVATVDAEGLVTAAGNGAATITATFGQESGTATVSVAQVVAALTVTPGADTLVEADTLRFSAEAADANGHTVGAAEFLWSTGDTLVAIVDDSGLVTGVAPGVAEVTATTSGVSGAAALTVAAAVPTTVAVTPDTVAFTAIGQTAQLSAEVRDQIGRVMEDEAVSWSSGDTAIAVVDATGLVTAGRRGTVTITASAGEASGTATVTIMQVAGSVVVSPAAGTISIGDTLQLLAEAFDDNGHAIDGPSFEWSSSDGVVATVGGGGVVRGAGEGTATITATLGDARGTSEITVENPDRAVLVALYNSTDGPNWVNSENWLTDAPLAEWYGVDVDASGRVAHLDLSGGPDDSGWLIRHGLEGPIPPEIGNLANLRELRLDGNELFGPIPTELGDLANLRSLNLRSNSLTGPIPPELGNLTELRGLNLSTNFGIEGEIPPELGNLTSLVSLQLSGNRLEGPIPPELGHLTELTILWLEGNDLQGEVPPEIGNLEHMRALGLNWNALTGPLPTSLLRLERLVELAFSDNDGLCAPGTVAFAGWLDGMEYKERYGPFCNAGDVAALKSLYETAGGTEWSDATGWDGEVAVEERYGVTADSLGRVLTLDLADNGLNGRLPSTMGSLTEMRVLRIGGNALSGRLPGSLANVPLRELQYADTDLCAPSEEWFQAWLNGIQSLEGTDLECPPPSDREILEALYEATGGPEWTNSDNWLTEAPLRTWHGVQTDREGRVDGLYLGRNRLNGPIPPELGGLVNLVSLELALNALTGWIPPELAGLANLQYMSLRSNQLAGPIPPELGDLASLEALNLGGNPLTGPIPPELGNLANVTSLYLFNNQLTGGIPAELGRLANLEALNLWGNELEGSIPRQLGNLAALERLYLFENALSGAIPTELGNLSNLKSLYLGDNKLTGPVPPPLGKLSALEQLLLSNNDLTGPVPPELGGMSSLQELSFTNNPGMSGPLPPELTALGRLEALQSGGTGLCAPGDPDFLAWLERVHKRRVNPCTEADPPTAYLVQAVQSREFPVPLVAGKRALLRVFPTARLATDAGLPAVRARFYRGGQQVHVENIPDKSTPIPTEVDEGSLSESVNAEISGDIVRPGLEMVIEVDPDGALDDSLGVAKRIPATGRLAVEVRDMPLFDLTLIPFIWTETHDSSIVELIEGMAADPGNHEMLGATRTLLPVGDLVVTAHEPVLSSSNSAFVILGETIAIRAMEGGTDHYMGMMARPVTGAAGIARRPGRVSFSIPFAGTVAHELGHNLNLQHSPCRDTPGADPSYPYANGVIGAWGYDYEDARLVPPYTPDLMGYCGPTWISDYQFSNALRYRLFDEGTRATAAARSLLLWGGVNAQGEPHLQPAFVIDAPALLPDSAGEHRITGRTVDGGQLFSFSFTMPETADGDGSSSFAFVLPTRPGWAGSLASITLTGPGGSAGLDADTNAPMAILRNPRTGQVRGILRDLPPATRTAADAVGRGAARGLDMLFSRGVPGAEAWRR